MAEELLKKAVVSIQCGTEGAEIYYTTDGQNPTEQSTKYAGSFDLWQNATVKAIGVKDGMTDSDIASQEYQIVLPTPVLSSQVDGDGATVSITNIADYAEHYGTVTYRYTTNGNDPTNDDPEFTNGMAINQNCTVKVIASATNNLSSAAGSTTISTVKVETPVISAVAG